VGLDFSEADLYAPIKGHFEGLGYVVRGEVRGCDMILSKDDNNFAVELKKSFNVTLLYQAMDRAKLTNGAYVAIPRSIFMRKRGHITHILEKLEIGLITVAMDSPLKSVAVHLVPNIGKARNNARSRALMAELNGRNFDGNTGGAVKQKLLTAHRERILHIACVLERLEVASAAVMVKTYGCHEFTNQWLRRNYYGWFEKVEKGLYALSEAGRAALDDPWFAKIVGYYRECINAEYQKQS